MVRRVSSTRLSKVEDFASQAVGAEDDPAPRIVDEEPALPQCGGRRA